MDAWLLEVAACPLADCGGRLAIAPGGSGAGRLRVGLLACTACKALYPVLAGVPILVPDPTAWLGSYRESVLASLAEHGAASTEAVSLIDSFTAAAAGAEPLRFGDDWTASEVGGAPVLRPPAGSEAAAAFERFLEAAAGAGPDETLLELLDGDLGCVWEVGCGAGTLSQRLRRRAQRLVVSDLSLRAVLRAREAACAEPGAPVAAAVVDAESLGLAPGAVTTVVAAELLDLLDHPERFVAGVADALADGGRLAIATPAPELGAPGEDDDVLGEVIEAAGLERLVERDAVPWIRAHDRRYFQVYFARVIIARAGSSRADT